MQTDTLLSWLADHLVSLCSQAQLGIVCSGLALELWQIAPAQLDPSERIELLLEHLAQTKLVPDFATGILRDETLSEEAIRRGLAELATLPTLPSESRSLALESVPGGAQLPTDESAVQTLLDEFDRHLAADWIS